MPAWTPGGLPAGAGPVTLTCTLVVPEPFSCMYPSTSRPLTVRSPLPLSEKPPLVLVLASYTMPFTMSVALPAHFC